MKPCLVRNCLCLARWKPSIVVAMADNDNKFRLDFEIPVCENHKDLLKVEDVIPDSSLSVIQEMFKSSFIHPPTRSDMTMEWVIDVPRSLPLVDSRGKNIGKVKVQ